MLNGKFFTGLPPKMIDRVSGGGRNRMESHLFWPDDTKVETAVETRIKRRNSVQLTDAERPLYKKLNSVVEDVDTRQRFSREFSQSSIQFYDNLNENNANTRRSMLRTGNKKMDITEKPTNTKLHMPESIVNEGYTADKKKQAYTSKIEFYDYANDKAEQPQNHRNNLRKPKMDMNDKREMELNAKNSPKLQVKSDVRSLSEEKEQRKVNNREVTATEGQMRDINEQRPERLANNENYHLRSRRSVDPDREIYREPLALSYKKRWPMYPENDGESLYSRNSERSAQYESERFTPRENENFENDSTYRCEWEGPKRMIRNKTRPYYDNSAERADSREYLTERDISDQMRDINLKSPSPSQPQKQYFRGEEYCDDEPQYVYDQNQLIKKPTNHGSRHQHFDYNERQDNEVDFPYTDFNNMPKRFNANKLPLNKINNQFEQQPVASPTSISPSPSDAESSVSGAIRTQKHLRSSLCFNNGEIIGENVANKSPTSSQYSAKIRNARSSATQRVSVGLPD